MSAIITERLIIRRPNESDLTDFLNYRNDAENLRFQPLRQIDAATALNNLKKQVTINEEQATGWIMFAIELKNEKKMIGEVGVYISSADQTSGDIGWAVHKDYHKNGYALEGAKVLLAYVFGLRRLERVTATSIGNNTASLLLMKRLGMQRVKDHSQNQFIDGVSYEEHLYSISRAEWHSITAEKK